MTVTDPPTHATRRLRRRRTFTWLGVAIGIGAGFLAGVLLVAALGGAKPAIHESTVTVRAPAAVTNGGTVIVKTIVPDVRGQPLDVAMERIARSGFDADVDGGGLFGIVVESNWTVAAQQPAPGGYLEQGSTIRLEVERR
jgi:hypothetical protein